MAKQMCRLVFAVIIFVVWSSTASAAHWMYAQRLEGTRLGPCHEYIDAESVARTGDRLVYWSLWRMEEPSGPHGIVKVLRKQEAILSEPQQARTLEYYYYDRNDEEISRYQTPGMFSAFDHSSRQALYYVDSARVTPNVKPMDLAVSLPRWFSDGGEHDGFQLYVDIRSIRGVTRRQSGDVPPEFEITVKQVWTPAGAAARMAELNRVEPAHHGYRSLAYSTTTYRFHQGRNQWLVLLHSDHDSNGVPLYFSFDNQWRDIEGGSLADQIRQIGVRWFMGEMEG